MRRGDELVLLPLLGAMRNPSHPPRRGRAEEVAAPLRGDEEPATRSAHGRPPPALLPLLGAMRNAVGGGPPVVPGVLLPLLGAMRNAQLSSGGADSPKVAAPLRGDEEPVRRLAVAAASSSCCPS